MPTKWDPSAGWSRAIPRAGASTTSAPHTRSAITTLGRPTRSAEAIRLLPALAGLRGAGAGGPSLGARVLGQQWVPQYYTYDAWIPGYFAWNGAWVQGRYETQTAESGGYYERVWVEGYWTE